MVDAMSASPSSPRLAAAVVIVLMSCKGSGGCPPSEGSDGEGTKGGTDTGLPPAPPPPPPGSDGADDTAGGGGGSTPLCLQDPIEGQWRTRLQCSGSLQASMTLDVSVAGFDVDQDPTPIERSFGNRQGGDAYSDPLVMGCCAEVMSPFCSSSASQSCYLDLIETSCQSLPARISEKANEQALPGPKEALQNLATWIGNNDAACRAAFGTSEVEAMAPACEAGGASSYESLLAGRQWAIPGTHSGGTTDISNVVFTVGQASVTEVFTNGAGAVSCWSLDDNDGTPHFLEIFPTGPLIESN